MIVCHELGHLFGGAPRRNVPLEWDGPIAHDGLSHLSSEGQADYYTSLVCFRKMLEVASAESPVVDYKRVGPKLKLQAGYKGAELKNCLRAGLAGEDFLKLTFEFPVLCEKEDTSVTDRLIRDSYPGRQCRLDTIVSGALCPDKLPTALDFDNMANTTCRKQQALRPQCWFP